jgi:hypothetical protein
MVLRRRVISSSELQDLAFRLLGCNSLCEIKVGEHEEKRKDNDDTKVSMIRQSAAECPHQIIEGCTSTDALSRN